MASSLAAASLTLAASAMRHRVPNNAFSLRSVPLASSLRRYATTIPRRGRETHTLAFGGRPACRIFSSDRSSSTVACPLGVAHYDPAVGDIDLPAHREPHKLGPRQRYRQALVLLDLSVVSDGQQRKIVAKCLHAANGNAARLEAASAHAYQSMNVVVRTRSLRQIQGGRGNGRRNKDATCCVACRTSSHAVKGYVVQSTPWLSWSDHLEGSYTMRLPNSCTLE